MIPRRKPRFYRGEFRDILRMVSQNKVGQGNYVKAFEEEFARYIGVRFAIATCSGRCAMELLLDSLGLTAGDEVILPAYTLADLVEIIKNKGLVPKFVDIEQDSFNINPELIESQITKKTKVIIATHLFGLPCNIKKITEIAQRYNIPVLEDCAHSTGAEVKGKKTGSLGVGGFFSLETTKLINTFGGGVVTTDDKSINYYIREKIKSYPVYPGRVLQKMLFSYIEHLIVVSPLYRLLNVLFMFKGTTKIISGLYLLSHSRTRVNRSKPTDLQALLGLQQLGKLDERNNLRDKLACSLSQALGGTVLPQTSDCKGDKRVFYFYAVRLKGEADLDIVRRRLLLSGVDAGIKNEVTDNCITYQERVISKFPVVDKVSSRVMQLPMYDGLRQRDIDYIADKLKDILANNV